MIEIERLENELFEEDMMTLEEEKIGLLMSGKVKKRENKTQEGKREQDLTPFLHYAQSSQNSLGVVSDSSSTKTLKEVKHNLDQRKKPRSVFILLQIILFLLLLFFLLVRK